MDLSSDYSGETEQAASVSESDCASKHIGVSSVKPWPVIFASAIMIFATLSVIWQCLSIRNDDKNVFVESSPKVTALHISDEAPLYKEPPPKYAQSLNHNEF